MSDDDEELPNESESVSESELKRAFRDLVLYMGESELYSLKSTITIPKDGGGMYNVSLSIEVENLEDTGG